MARLINDLSVKITVEGASFARQHLLDKGLEALGKRGHDASIKEKDQLNR